MKGFLKAGLILVLSVLLSGCVDWIESKQDLVAFVNETKAAPAGSIDPLPEFKPYHSFVYEGASMREPFIELIKFADIDELDKATEVTATHQLQPDLSREKEYLESFAVEQLKMVGSISVQERLVTWGLVKDAKAEVHRVGVGAYLGLDFGKVIEVDEQKIVLSEIITNGRGGWMKRSRNIMLTEQVLSGQK